MSLQDDLFTKISNNATMQGLIGTTGTASATRFYPLVAPTSATLPYTIYTRDDNAHGYTQRAADGLATAFFTFASYAASIVSAAAVAEGFRGILQGMTTATWGSTAIKRVLLKSESDRWEDQGEGDQLGTGGKFVVVQQWEIWYAESIPSL